MGSWTKRTLRQAARAQSSLGELLKLPVKRYKELNEECTQVRARAEELARVMGGGSLTLAGASAAGGLQSLAGKGGVLVGTELDKELVRVRWERRAETWAPVPGASGGFYRTSVDDVGCLLRVKVATTPLFRRLTNTGGQWVVQKAERIVLGESLRTAVAQYRPMEAPVAFRLKSKLDPAHPCVLEIARDGHGEGGEVGDGQRDGHGVVVTLGVADGEGAVDTASDATDNDPYGGAQAVLPADTLRVWPHGSTALSLVLREQTFTLFASSNLERDCVVLLLRQVRSRAQPELPPNFDHLLLVTDCMYPEVWDLLYPRQKRGSLLALSSKALFDALDPLRAVGGTSSTASTSLSSRSTPSSSISNANAAQPVADLDAPVEFDLYAAAGMGAHYDVTVELEAGEGLGITLALFELVAQPKAQPWPAGAACVCVRDFCPIAGGLPGQLERSGRIRSGDALVAINGIGIAPEVATWRDLAEYRPCSLGKVAQVVQQIRGQQGGEEQDQQQVRSSGASAAVMRFTFAQASSKHGAALAGQKALRGKMAELREQLKQSHEQSRSVVRQWQQQQERQRERAELLREAVEAQHEAAARAEAERDLLAEELQRLKAQHAAQARAREAEARAHAKAKAQLEQECEELRAHLAREQEKVARMAASMDDLADEGKAWVNTIGSKEDALRALETELRAEKVRHERLQQLLDTTRCEREGLQQRLSAVEQELEEREDREQRLERQVDAANQEADALTARMRLEKEEADNDLQRARHDADRLRKQLQEATEQLAASKTLSSALKEAQAAAEDRAREAVGSLAAAESAAAQAREDAAALNDRVVALQNRLRNAPANGPANGSGSGSGGGGGGGGESAADEAKLAARVSELEGANAALRGQVKALRHREQSLTAEASKASQLDAAVAERNELMVETQLERARRLEAEDELTAYKRALKQFAAQAQREEREGRGNPWSNRPRIFDHLYRGLRHEEDRS